LLLVCVAVPAPDGCSWLSVSPVSKQAHSRHCVVLTNQISMVVFSKLGKVYQVVFMCVPLVLGVLHSVTPGDAG